MCELRERRLEQEELYADFQKGVDGLKKENDALIRKEKVIDKALKDTEADIQAFQTEKQGKLNQLLVVVTLQMRQARLGLGLGSGLGLGLGLGLAPFGSILHSNCGVGAHVISPPPGQSASHSVAFHLSKSASRLSSSSPSPSAHSRVAPYATSRASIQRPM